MSVEIPALGALRAGPMALHICGTGSCDATGFATATFAAPRDPALAGRTIYWQALIGAAPKFSNLEATTFDR